MPAPSGLVRRFFHHGMSASYTQDVKSKNVKPDKNLALAVWHPRREDEEKRLCNKGERTAEQEELRAL